MLRNKPSFCLLIIVCFIANFLVLPQLHAQGPKINVTVTPKSEAQSPKAVSPKVPETPKVKASGNQPVLFIEQRQYDAGEVWEGDIVSHSFIVKNTGKAELNISNVKPG